MTNRLTKSRPLTEHESMNLSLTGLYMRLKAHEETGLEPEEVDRFAKAVKEGPLVVFPRGDDVTPIKCTGMKCPMQAGKVDPATCKAADTCKWTTKPMTNADEIRAMNDEQLAELFTDTFDDENIFYCPVRQQHRCLSMDCKVCFLDWLKQEVGE